MANFNTYIANTLEFEGLYQNQPSDSGNYCYYFSNGKRYRGAAVIGTMRGISAVAFQEVYGYCPTVAQLKAITVNQAKDIYKKKYFDNWIKGSLIKDEMVAYMAFTCVIGALTNISIVRKAVNKVAAKYNKPPITERAVPFTEVTVNIINSLPGKEIFNTLWNDYVAYLRGRASATLNTGWFTRMDTIKNLAAKYYSGYSKTSIKSTGVIAPAAALTFTALFFAFKLILNTTPKTQTA